MQALPLSQLLTTLADSETIVTEADQRSALRAAADVVAHHLAGGWQEPEVVITNGWHADPVAVFASSCLEALDEMIGQTNSLMDRLREALRCLPVTAPTPCRPGQACPDQTDDHVHCYHRGQCCHCACPGDGRSVREGRALDCAEGC